MTNRADEAAAGRRAAPAFLLSLLLAACAAKQPLPSTTSLPDYAQPKAETMRAERYTATDTIRYRALTRDDFRGAQPPRQLGDNAKSMGAFTCASIVPEGDPRVSFHRKPDGGTVARLERATFHAEMERACSWWNAEVRLDGAYILQHEQIHFGLTEMQARRLTARMQDVEVVARSPEQATREIQQIYDQMATESSEDLVRDATSFDQETSFRYAPEAQARWMRFVEQEIGRAPAAAR
jgi:hypothetical protein